MRDWLVLASAVAACGDPVAEVVPTTDGGSEAEVCLFWECTNPGTLPEQACEGASTPAVTPAGRDGCCDTGSVSIAVDCDGDNQDVLVFVSVSEGVAEVCTDYTLMYEGIAADLL